VALEGVRLVQLPLIAVFYGAWLTNFMQRLFLDNPVLDGMWFYTLAGLFYFYLRLKYGFCNFDDTDTTGPFRVGYSTLKGDNGNQCAVFYPIDREEGEKTGKGMFPKLVR